jgi:hypothetical protein
VELAATGARALPEPADAPRSTARGAALSMVPGEWRRAATGRGRDACMFWAKRLHSDSSPFAPGGAERDRAAFEEDFK